MVSPTRKGSQPRPEGRPRPSRRARQGGRPHTGRTRHCRFKKSSGTDGEFEGPSVARKLLEPGPVFQPPGPFFSVHPGFRDGVVFRALLDGEKEGWSWVDGERPTPRAGAGGTRPRLWEWPTVALPVGHRGGRGGTTEETWTHPRTSSVEAASGPAPRGQCRQ